MKQFLIATLLLLTLSFTANAQATASADATLTIKINSVLSIQVLDPNVDFVYNTAESYGTDQTVSKVNHLSVISSTNFKLEVKSTSTDFNSANGTIPVSVVTISLPNLGNFGGTYSGDKVLSNTNQPLVSDAPSGFNKLLDVDYIIPANKASTTLLSKPEGTYSELVTYTVTAS